MEKKRLALEDRAGGAAVSAVVYRNMLLGPGSQETIIDIKRFPSIYVCGCIHRNIGCCNCEGRYHINHKLAVWHIVAWGPKDVVNRRAVILTMTQGGKSEGSSSVCPY
jgi:hypothetical protein